MVLDLGAIELTSNVTTFPCHFPGLHEIQGQVEPTTQGANGKPSSNFKNTEEIFPGKDP